MKKINYMIIIALFILVSCESSNEPKLNSEDFFPLEIGNKWFYSSYPDTNNIEVIREVVSKKVINNKKYYEIYFKSYNNKSSGSNYYRLNKDTLFNLNLGYDERVLADFSLSLNETAYWNSDLVVKQKTNNMIRYETPFAADQGSSITYKKGVGMVRMEQNGFIYHMTKLVKAEIK